MGKKPWEYGPLHVSDNHKYLFHGETPFYWMGDTAWLMLQRSSREDVDTYLKNRADKGFNVIQTDFVHTVPQTDHFGNHAVAGDTDFTKPLVEGEYTYWDHVEYAIAKAEELGLQMVAEESYQGGAADFRSQLTNIKGQNPDVLFLPVYYEDLRLISAQAKEVGVEAQLCGADGWDSVLTDNFDSSVLEGGVFCSQYSTESTDERVQNFISTYKETYDMDPNMFAVLAYDATYMMAQAISDAGSTDSQAIIDAMAALEYDGLTGTMTFDADRNPQKSAVIVAIEGNAYKYVENYDPEQ